MPFGQYCFVVTNSSRVTCHSVRFALLLVVLLGAANFASQAAANPFTKLIVFNRPDADPDKSYTLTDTNGPWMILAVTFSGDEAARQANELVLELRKRYKLPAFAHKKKFNFEKIEGNGIDKYGDPLTMRYQRGDQVEEIAVLVGEFSSVDDPEAQKTLKKIKYLEPLCLEIKQGKKVSIPLAALRTIQRSLEPGFVDEQKKGYVRNVKQGRGPLGNAFLVTNPLLPREYFVPTGLDPFIFEMNERVRPIKYSLLKCPGKYSVKVATFTGNVVFDPKKINSIEKGSNMPSRLAEAGEAAHNLTEALRKKGVEAYEFHDRNMSLVTVGSFDSVGNSTPDGGYQMNPAVVMIMETYGAEKVMQPGQSTPVLGKPKTHDGIPYDIQPLPIEVPRQSISAQFAQPLGMR